jgi:hypothetical protein
LFLNSYTNTAETNVVFGNTNDTNLNTGKIDTEVFFTKVGNDTYFEFNTNQVNYGLTDTAIKEILLYRYSYMNDTLAALIVSPKLKTDNKRADIISSYNTNKAASILTNAVFTTDTAAAILTNAVFTTDTAAAILSNTVFTTDTAAAILSNMPSDTAAAILYAGDTYFNSDTRLINLFNINYGTSKVNLTLLSTSFTDSLTISGRLIDLDTTYIIYPANSQTYTDTNYFMLNWKNIKGAIGSWKIELATDTGFTTDYEKIIVDVNTPAKANTTTNYKQLSNKVWYMRVRPYSVKIE